MATSATSGQVIEVDITEYTAGTSNYYSSNAQSETQSVNSSVFNFTYDNGRRYTTWGGDNKYFQRK